MEPNSQICWRENPVHTRQRKKSNNTMSNSNPYDKDWKLNITYKIRVYELCIIRLILCLNSMGTNCPTTQHVGNKIVRSNYDAKWYLTNTNIRNVQHISPITEQKRKRKKQARNTTQITINFQPPQTHIPSIKSKYR